MLPWSSAAIPDADVPVSVILLRSPGSGIKYLSSPVIAFPITMALSFAPVVGPTTDRPRDGASALWYIGADEEVVAFVDKYRARLTELFPCGDEIAVLVEDLDAIVLTIGNVHDTPWTRRRKYRGAP